MTPRTPLGLYHILSLSLLPWIPLSHPPPRTAPSPRLVVAAPTATASPLFRAQTLRAVLLVLSTKSRCARSSTASSTLLFSSSVVRDRRRLYVAVRPSPSPLRCLLQPP